MDDRSLVNLNRAVFIFLSLLTFVFFTFGQSLVPTIFTQDSETIRLAMLGGIDGAYGATAEFYKLIGFNYNSPELLVELFSWFVYIVSLLIIFKICRGNIISASKMFLIFGYTLAFGFYYATFSKDVILILFTMIIALIFLKRKIYYHFPIIFLFYGLYFRQYWIIVSIMVMLCLVLNLKKIRPMLVVFMTIIMIYLFEFFTGTYITDTRTGVNVGRVANTMINNLVPNTSFFTDVLNYFYVLISMIIPIQGIGSINGIVYYIWIWLFISIVILKRRELNINMMYLIIVYFSIQACFEPDFGSAIRHMVALILVAFLALFRGDNSEFL